MSESTAKRTTVLLLGAMGVDKGSSPIPVRGAKQRILLAHLALSDGRPVPMSRLISDLWGEQPRSAHALQEHVSRLRTTLGVEITLVEGAGYSISPDLIDTDVQRFTSLYDQGRQQLSDGDAQAARATLEEGMNMWRGPFLEDLAGVDGLRSYKLHVDQMRRHLRSLRIDAYLECGLGEQVVTDIRDAVERDPLREHSWYQLIRALEQAGQRTEALQTFHDAREVFIDVLGVEPSQHLIEFHTQLLRADAHPPSPASPQYAPVTLTEVTRASSLVGRQFEVRTLERLWNDASRGLQTVTITGEPGVGKSRLTSEVTAMAAAQGALILRGDCEHGTTVPYQPFAQMLQGSIDFAQDAQLATSMQRHAAGLARVLPNMAALFPASDLAPVPNRADGGDMLSMDAIAAWFEALSVQRKILLVLEDLQWADEQSVLMLHQLIRSTRTIRGMLVVTIRDHEVTDRGADSDALPDLLARSDGITHLPLRRLSSEETGQLVSVEAAQAGFETLPEWAESYVQTASGGNPLYTIELTRHLLATGTYDERTIPAPPASLRQVIEGHLSALGESASALLAQAAALGTEFDPAYLTTVTGLSTAEVDHLLQQAVLARLIEKAPGNARSYQFSHEVVRTVLYESIPPLERAQLHTKIAQTLATPRAMSRAQHLQTLAHHLKRSDEPDGKVRAAIHLKDAGHQALDIGAPAEAGALFTQALDLLDGTAPVEVVCDTLLGLGAAQLRYADPEFRETLLRAARLAMDLGDSERLILAVLLNSRGWWSSSTQIDHERVEGIEAALAACDREDQVAYSQLLAAWALENVRDPGSRQEVLARSAQALGIADELGNVQALHTALAARFAVMYALFEGPAECVNLGRRLLDLGQSQADRMMALSGLLCLGQASMRFGDYHVADRCVEHAQQLAMTVHHPPRLWLAKGWAAMREATRGRFEAAHALAHETYELGMQTGQSDASTWYMGQLYTFKMMQGALPEIVADVGEHAAEVADAIPAWRAAMALALAQAGETKQAAGILEEFAAGDFEQLPRDILWLNGMGYLAMTCAAVGRQDLAGGLYDRLVPYSGMVATNGTIDAGPVDLHLSLLAQLLGNSESAATHSESAVALSRKIGAPVWLAHLNAQPQSANSPR